MFARREGNFKMMIINDYGKAHGVHPDVPILSDRDAEGGGLGGAC